METKNTTVKDENDTANTDKEIAKAEKRLVELKGQKAKQGTSKPKMDTSKRPERRRNNDPIPENTVRVGKKEVRDYCMASILSMERRADDKVTLDAFGELSIGRLISVAEVLKNRYNMQIESITSKTIGGDERDSRRITYVKIPMKKGIVKKGDKKKGIVKKGDKKKSVTNG